MTASDINGWDVDPDLEQLHPDWPVRVEMINTYRDEDDVAPDLGKVMRYEALYREHGAWALPPVVCIGDSGWQIAGAHRMEAAWRAGLTRIPAFIVSAP